MIAHDIVAAHTITPCSAVKAAAASLPCSQVRNRRFFDVTPVGA